MSKTHKAVTKIKSPSLHGDNTMAKSDLKVRQGWQPMGKELVGSSALFHPLKPLHNEQSNSEHSHFHHGNPHGLHCPSPDTRIMENIDFP